MARQFNESRTKRPTRNAIASLNFIRALSFRAGPRNLLFFNRGLRGFSETDQQRLLAFKQGPIIGKTKAARLWSMAANCESAINYNLDLSVVNISCHCFGIRRHRK